MRRWREIQNIPFEAFLAPDQLHMNESSYDCLAWLLADAIIEAVIRPQLTAGANLQSQVPGGAEHEHVRIPMLFLQGARDTLAMLDQLKPLCESLASVRH